MQPVVVCHESHIDFSAVFQDDLKVERQAYFLAANQTTSTKNEKITQSNSGDPVDFPSSTDSNPMTGLCMNY